MRDEIKHIDDLATELEACHDRIEDLRRKAVERLTLSWDNYEFSPCLDVNEGFKVKGYNLWQNNENTYALIKCFDKLDEIVQSVDCAKEYIFGERAKLEEFKMMLDKHLKPSMAPVMRAKLTKLMFEVFIELYPESDRERVAKEKIQMLKDSLDQPSSLPEKFRMIQHEDIKRLIKELESELP